MSRDTTADIVICGAGIAGVAAAYHLCAGRGFRDVLLIDERAPLTLTSDKSTEAYRNWWPGPDDAMVRFMNRSIDLLEGLADESGNRIHLNRRGYVYATARPDHAERFRRDGKLASAQGAGPLRVHRGSAGEPAYIPHGAEGFSKDPGGADLIVHRGMIRKHFPYLSEQTCAVLHARRCGWFSGQQLGMLLLEKAKEHGARYLRARVTAVATGGGTHTLSIAEGNGPAGRVGAQVFIDAAGPMLGPVAAMLGVDLPVFSELHLKASFNDHLGAVPRDAPLLIWDDGQVVSWRPDVRDSLAADEATRYLTEAMPPGVHMRPEGGPGSRSILILWPYHVGPVPEVFPLPEDPFFADVVIRGMSAMIPGLAPYVERMPRPHVDGGYYTKTRENRFLCGPLPAPGTFVIGALSGYGLMASCAAGELLAAHVAGDELPDYAPAFSLDRYDDPSHGTRFDAWGSRGQL